MYLAVRYLVFIEVSRLELGIHANLWLVTEFLQII